jgi:hypothetical protein
LQLIREDSRWIRLAFYNAERRALRNVDETADVQFLDVAHDLCIRGCVSRGETSMVCSENKLAGFFVEGHFAERGLDPLGGRWRQFLRGLRRRCTFLRSRCIFCGRRRRRRDGGRGRSLVLTACRVGHKKKEQTKRNEKQNACTASFHQLWVSRWTPGSCACI